MKYKYFSRLATATAIVFAMGCSDVDGSIPDNSPQYLLEKGAADANENAQAVAEAMSGLKEKIHVDASMFNLDFDMLALPQTSPKSAEEAIGALQKNVDDGSKREWISETSVDQPRADQIVTMFNFDRGVFTVRDGRGYQTVEKLAAPKSIKAGYVEKSKKIAAGFIDNIDEISDTVEVPLNVSRKTFGKKEITKETIAMKVFAKRKIQGIPVNDERLVFSYANDGSFRKLLGIWTRIDYSQTSFDVAPSEGKILDNGAKELYAAGVLVDEVESAEITPVFVTEPIGNGYHRLVLRGLMNVTVSQTADNQAPGTPMELLVDLN